MWRYVFLNCMIGCIINIMSECQGIKLLKLISSLVRFWLMYTGEVWSSFGLWHSACLSPTGIGHSLNHSTKSVIKPSLNWSGAVARVSLERAAAMGRPLTLMSWCHPSEALSLGLGWRVTPGVIPISHSPFLEVTLTTNPSLVDSCHQKPRKQVMVSTDYTAHNTTNVPPLAIWLWTLPLMLTVG